MATKSMEFDIVGGYSKEQYNELDPQETVNMYQINGVNGKKALFPSPGLSLVNGIEFVQSANKKGRQACIFQDSMFVTIGDDIYRCKESSGTLDHAKIGSVNTLIGYMANTNLENDLVFADGVNGWIWNESASTFTQIPFGFTIKPIDICTFKNRIIALNAETGQWYYCDVNDATTWDILNLNTFPNGDINVACKPLGERLYIFGQVSTEIYAARQGATLYPFQPVNLLEIGCASAASVAQKFGILVWLSRTDAGVGSVMATSGDKPEPISDSAIDTVIAKIANVSDASGYLYKNENGHTMYRLNFTAANKSYEYDFNTKKWARLEYAKAKTPGNRHLGQKHAYFHSKHYVVDYNEPKLYEMSTNYGDDAGVRIRRARISSVLEAPAGKRIQLNSVTLRLKQGIGGDNNIDEDPRVFLYISTDEGESYGNALSARIGKSGQRTWETTFDRLVNARSIVLWVEYYETKPFIISRANVNYDIVEAA